MKTMDECADPLEDGQASREAGAATSAGPNAPTTPATRVVARVIDPAVRDDGRGDPQFTMQVRRERHSAAAGAPSASHPVRERLLARAKAAIETSAASANLPAAPDPRPLVASESRPAESAEEPFFGFESVPEVADDLDLIGAPDRPRPERTPYHAPRLPPTTALLAGTLAGLAAILGLFGALIYFDPHEPLRIDPPAPVVEAPAPVAPEEPAPAPPVGNVQRPPRARVPGPWRIGAAGEDPRQKRVSSSMGDRSFLGATQAVGVSLKDAYRVLTAFEGIKNLDRCRPKDTFTALLDAESGRLTAFEYVVSEEEVYQARAGQDGRLTARKLDLEVQRHRAQGVVVLDGGFEDSARRSGFEPGLGDYVNKALSSYVSTSELRAGDVLGVVAQEVTVLGAFARYAGVEALEYRPVGGEPLRVYYHEASRGYVDSRGRAFGKSRWTRPVPGAGVTSRFNPKRMHPILKRIKPHNGTDFGAPVGTPVVAAAAGKVSFVGRAGPNGNMVTIAHVGGYQTGYSHLSRFAKGLKAGANVEQKQLIGYVGSTGRSTGPHLHFSAKKSGRFVDPESLNLDGLARLAQDQRLSNEQRRRYDRMLDALKLPEARTPRVAAQSVAAQSVAPASEPAAIDPGSLQVAIAAARAAPNPADPAAVAFPAAPASPSGAPNGATSVTGPPATGVPAAGAPASPAAAVPAATASGTSPAGSPAPANTGAAHGGAAVPNDPLEDAPPAMSEPDGPNEPAPPDAPGEGGPPADEDLE
jgi:murein DD-endopeptidase MepM/ murein hydrolase activator NlpD